MKAIALLGVALFVMASGVFGAGSENIIKQRAKDLRDQNNARQGVTQPTPQFTPAAPVPAASSSSASAQTADPALSKVQTTLSTVKRDGMITEELKSQVTTDLLAAARGRKPTEATVEKLAQQLLAAQAEKPLESKRLARVLQNLGVVLNAGKSTPAKVSDAVFNLEATFQAEGFARAKAEAISKTAKTIADETQPGAAR